MTNSDYNNDFIPFSWGKMNPILKNVKHLIHNYALFNLSSRPINFLNQPFMGICSQFFFVNIFCLKITSIAD